MSSSALPQTAPRNLDRSLLEGDLDRLIKLVDNELPECEQNPEGEPIETMMTEVRALREIYRSLEDFRRRWREHVTRG